jgi:hypothetical protein
VVRTGEYPRRASQKQLYALLHGVAVTRYVSAVYPLQHDIDADGFTGDFQAVMTPFGHSEYSSFIKKRTQPREERCPHGTATVTE